MVELVQDALRERGVDDQIIAVGQFNPRGHTGGLFVGGLLGSDAGGALGAALWAERARAELKRISGRAATPGALTPAEERVAALVAEGKTNREVAAALFLSERTVEGHLARIFGKLGIRHRTEIASVLTPTQTQGVSTPNTGGSPVSAESRAS